MTRIALCMIVRDEEQWLPGCLQSVAGLADELVVVDTGSSDRTVALAVAAGAVVVPFVWVDDFAAARNAALAATRCEWLLQLDADERLAPGAVAALRRACDEGGFDCGFLTLCNARRVDDAIDDVLTRPGCRYDEPTALPRLFRRDDEFRWQGRVHENVSAWLEGRRVRNLDVALVHYGYTPEVAVARGKKQRNLTLLERWCHEQPDNPLPWTYLAWERQGASDPAIVQTAAEAADAGWQALARLAATIPEHAWSARLPSPVALATVKAMHQLGRGALDDVDATLRQAARWGARHPNLDLLQAQIAERRVDAAVDEAARAAGLDDACQAYERCLAAAGQVFTDWLIDGATSWFPATGLGLCRLARGDPSGALAALF